MIRRPPISTLFPYTPLFLSGRDVRRVPDCDPACAVDEEVRRLGRQDQRFHARLVVVGAKVDGLLVDVGEHLLGKLREARLGVPHRGRGVAMRSEEHTSELQSQSNLVCRLLLEKKKKHYTSVR